MIDVIGGRKVLVVGLAVLVGVGFVFLKGDVPANFLTLLQWAIGLFIAGNLGEHAANAYTATNTAPDTVPVPPPLAPVDHTDDLVAILKAIADLQTIIEGLSKNDHELANAVAIVQQSISLIIKKYGIADLPDPPARA